MPSVQLPEISKIKLNGTEYLIKDAEARSNIPLAEDDENVEEMLTDVGLNATVTLEPAVLGVARVGKAVVLADEEEEDEG